MKQRLVALVLIALAPAAGAAEGCAIEGPSQRLPEAVAAIELGISRAMLEKLLGPADYSPARGIHYYATGGDCPLEDSGRFASCGVVAEFEQDALKNCRWGAIGE